MGKIKDILTGTMSESDRIALMKEKATPVPPWADLQKEYDPELHAVNDKQSYRDLVRNSGIEHVTRILLNFEQLASKRTTELVCGIPVKRIYKPANERQKLVAQVMEAIFIRNRIDSVNVERINQLFAGCEIFTLWFAVEQPNDLYGVRSKLKMRCRTFSPMLGDKLYPLFDEYGDMVAMSIAYTRKVGGNDVQFFDTYTDDRHLKWSNAGGDWEEVENDHITLMKIPGVYAWRPTPVWEKASTLRNEMEWALSRNGNYLRENSKPRFIVFAEKCINYGDEKGADEEFKSIMQYPKGSSAQYVTWEQAVESLKFYIEQLRSLFFTQLQLPDWSYEKMSQQALSGESRKQMFIDAELKVGDESGRLLEMFDRECNVVKAFVKLIMGAAYHADIDALIVENVITPYRITDKQEELSQLLAANGNMPVMSQRESIEAYGHSEDVDETLRQIQEQGKVDAFDFAE